MREAAAGSGRVLSRGAIRVDARRALGKLREHLLVDLHAYALEVVRSAVLGGATAVDVSYDADDVVLAFDGRPFETAELPRLLDYVLTPAEGEDGVRLRRLASGVNAALGLDPVSVDVWTGVEAGVGHRTRFVPRIVAEGGDPGPPVEVERMRAPPSIAALGNGVHVERRVGWALLRRFFTREPPPEVGLVVATTSRSPLELRVQGQAVRRTEPAPCLLRARIAGPGIRSGVLEVRTESSAPPAMELSENGVRLLSIALLPPRLSIDFGGRYLPMAAYVDAGELPTNASRSGIREDDPWFLRLRRDVDLTIEEALTKIIDAYGGVATPSEAIELATDDRAQMARALGAMLCIVRKIPSRQLPSGLRRLRELPLFQTATGEAMSYAALRRRRRRRTLYEIPASVPVGPELRPWAEDIVVRRGDAADPVLEDFALECGEDRLELAVVGAEKRRHTAARRGPGPLLELGPDRLFLERFDHPDGEWKGLRGEVALLTDATVPEIRVFVDDHRIETHYPDRAWALVPFVAAIAWDDAFVPTPSYDGVQPGPALDAAFARVRVIALRATVAASTRASDAIRSALRGALLADESMRADEGLRAAPLFPTRTHGWVGLARLEAACAQGAALCFVRPRPHRGRTPDGRLIAVLTRTEAERVASVLSAARGLPIECVPYERAFSDGPPAEPADLAPHYRELFAIEGQRPPVLAWKEGRLRALLAPHEEGAMVRMHGGVVLDRRKHRTPRAHLAVVLDDDRIVPNDRWDAVRWPKSPSGAPMRQALLAALVGGLSGDERAKAAFLEPLDSDALALRSVRYFLLSAGARHLRRRKTGDLTLQNQLDDLPLLQWLVDDGSFQLVSPREVDAYHAWRSVPYVRDKLFFETGEWRPLLLESPEDLDFAQARFPQLEDGQGDIAARRATAVRHAKKRELFERPVEDARAPFGALEGAPVVHIDGPSTSDKSDELSAPKGGYRAWLSVRGAGHPADALGDGSRALVRLLHRGHPVQWFELPNDAPITVAIEVDDENLLDDYSTLSPAGRSLVVEVVQRGLLRLARKLLRTEGSGAPAIPWWMTNEAALAILHRAIVSARALPVVKALRTVDWPTVQGGSGMLQTLARKGKELLFATERYTNWVSDTRRADLDWPIPWIAGSAAGEIVKKMLERAGYELRDVTIAVQRLQRRRSEGTSHVPLRLPGEPVHARLRLELGASPGDLLQGEVEIVQAPPSEIDLVGANGATRRVATELPFPLRAIARHDLAGGGGHSDEDVVRDIAKIAMRALTEAVRHLDDLPPWVRDHVRRVLCDVVRKDQLGIVWTGAAVLPDTNGRFHAFRAFSEVSEDRYFTTMAPPFPDLPELGPVLVLTPVEAAVLATKLGLIDAADVFARAVSTGDRATAPPQRAELPSLARADCFAVAPLGIDAMVGEVGLLSPGRSEGRGISVLTRYRGLCRVDDQPGWPLIAAVNDDTLEPNRFFDGIASKDRQDALVAAVRRVADGVLAAHARPPEDVLVAAEVADRVGDGELRGWVWLPSTWPVAPMVTLLHPLRRVDLPAPVTEGGMSRRLPISARIFVLAPTGAEPSREAIASLLHARAMALCAKLDAKGFDADCYRWNFALLGSRQAPPIDRSAGGELVDVAAVRTELATRGEVWVSDGRGVADGAFPGHAPAFVLRADSALAHVLRHRAVVHDLGDLRAAPLPPTAAEAPIDPPPDALAVSIRTACQGLGGLIRAVAVAEPTGRSRLVHYEPTQEMVYVDRSAPLLARYGRDLPAEVRFALTVAAVAEVERSVGGLADAEERRLLGGLLEEWISAETDPDG